MPEGRHFQRERITDLWDELAPLASANVTEASNTNPEYLPRKEIYESMEASDSHRFFTARINKKLVGYCSMMVNRSMYSGVCQAHEDAIYVAPEHRGFLGNEFQRWVDDMLFYDGVTRVFRERMIHESGDRALRRGPIGYKHHSVLWKRDLKAVAHG